MKKLLYIIGLILLFAANTATANADFFGARVEVVAKGGSTLASKLTGSLKATYDDLIKAGYKVADDGVEIIFKNVDDLPIAKISDDAFHIKIPDTHGGWATQSTSDLSKRIQANITKDKTVYRLGKSNISEAGEAQYWSPENPYSFNSIQDYARKYGIPEANLKGDGLFFEVGKIPENVPFVTREAPGFGNNAGGAIEVVVPSKTIKLESFSTVKFE